MATTNSSVTRFGFLITMDKASCGADSSIGSYGVLPELDSQERIRISVPDK